MNLGLQAVCADRAACKCCGATALPYGVVDFHKNCEIQRRRVLGVSGVPIYYYRCPACRSSSRPRSTISRRTISSGTCTTRNTFWSIPITWESARANADFLIEPVLGRQAAARPRLRRRQRGSWRTACGPRVSPGRRLRPVRPAPFGPPGRPLRLRRLLRGRRALHRPGADIRRHDGFLGRAGADHLLDVAPARRHRSPGPELVVRRPPQWPRLPLLEGEPGGALEPFGFGIASFNDDLHVLYREIPDFARHFLIPLDQYAVDPYTTTVLA